jgi:hypothetical protein
MGETKLNVSIPSNNRVHSNLTWRVEANCMLFKDEIKLKVSMHTSDQVNSNLTWQVGAKCMLLMDENQVKSKHSFK